MALDAPFYLAIGDCVIEDDTATTAYHAQGGLSFPEPDPDGLGGHNPAVRTITVRVTGATTAALNANIAALRRAAVRDATLYFRPAATGDVLSCRIREARVVEDSYDPLWRSVTTDPKTTLTVTLTTDPYWLGAWTAVTTPTVAAIPGHFDVTGVTGEVDALLTMRVCPGAVATGIAVGVKPDPGAGYDYLDDYQGSADANALSGEKATLSASGTLAAIGTAPDIDTNDNRGRHLLLARVDSTGTASATTVKARTTTTGNLVSETTSVDEQVKTLAYADLVGIELGDVVIPAGQVPDITTGTGYAAESIGAQNTTAATLATIVDTGRTQSFPVAAACLHTGVTVKVKSTGGATMAVALYAATADHTPTGAALGTTTVAVPAATDGEVRATWSIPLSAGTYCVKISGSLEAYHSTASSYATYKESIFSAQYHYWVASDTDDLYFKSWTRVPLGFNTTNPVLAACSESSKTVALDYVQRIPVDYAAVVYRLGASGYAAFYYDGDTDTPYLADSDGIGPAQYAKCEIRKPLRLKPGVTNRVVVGLLQNDSAVAGFSALTYSYRPRFLTATG